MECNIFIFLYYLHVYIFLQFDLKYNAHSMQLQEKKYPPKDTLQWMGAVRMRL